MRIRAPLVLAALVATLALAPSTAHATRSCRTISSAGGDVLRVYALRGVSCAKAVKIAKIVVRRDAPSPWRCFIGTGQRYRHKPISFACGYGSRGPIMKRRHAFVAVQAHTSG